MEGAEITFERLEYVMRALKQSRLAEQVFCSFLGVAPREDLIPYVADFFLQLEDVKWTIVSGIVNESLIISVRNLGYSRNAGEFVRRWFADIGSAGGHRAMAKAVVPLGAFRAKFGELHAEEMNLRILDLATQFLREHQPNERRRETVTSR
jgi:nanoRNase/pAp phosphatase (c-di-AMP/oligoRNAs hydrolase)